MESLIHYWEWGNYSWEEKEKEGERKRFCKDLNEQLELPFSMVSVRHEYLFMGSSVTRAKVMQGPGFVIACVC